MRKTQAKHAGKSRSKPTPAKLKRATKARAATPKRASRKTTPRAVVSTSVAANKKNRSANSYFDNSHSDTKQAQVIAMLRAPSGATVDAIAAAVGWQQHSVRGFFAGIIKKKLGLDLISERGEDGRVYRVVEGKPAIATKVRQVA